MPKLGSSFQKGKKKKDRGYKYSSICHVRDDMLTPKISRCSTWIQLEVKSTSDRHTRKKQPEKFWNSEVQCLKERKGFFRWHRSPVAHGTRQRRY